MHLIILGLGLAAAAASSAPAPAPETASETRIIAVELREGERLVATPSLAVQLGRPASLSIQDFGLSLVVDRAGDGYFLSSGLYWSSGNGWTLLGQPSLTVTQGAPARLSFTGADGRNLTMAVEIR
jgi:hypothetical protein